MIATIKFLNKLVHRSWPEWTNDRNEMVPNFNWVLFAASWDNALHKNILLFGFMEKAMMPCLVAKVCRMAENGWSLEAEYNNLVELWQCLGDQAPDRLPRPMNLSEKERRKTLITSFLPGQTLLQESRTGLWDSPANLSQLMMDAAESLSFFHGATSTPLTVNEIIDHPFNDKKNLFCELFPVNEIELQILERLNQLVAKQIGQAGNKVLIHGDFWHGNMMRNAEHGRLMLIDWQFARWSKDVSLDVYLFLLAGAVAAAPYCPEEQRARAAARILLQWQKEWIAAYLDAYTIPQGCVLLPEKYGMLACCVEMAVRPLSEFNYRHKDDILWYSLFRELCKMM